MLFVFVNFHYKPHKQKKKTKFDASLFNSKFLVVFGFIYLIFLTIFNSSRWLFDSTLRGPGIESRPVETNRRRGWTFLSKIFAPDPEQTASITVIFHIHETYSKYNILSPSTLIIHTND